MSCTAPFANENTELRQLFELVSAFFSAQPGEQRHASVLEVLERHSHESTGSDIPAGEPARIVADARTAAVLFRIYEGRPRFGRPGAEKGSKHLLPDEVREIRRRCAAGEPRSQVAFEFGVRKQTISNVVKGKTFKDVT